MSKSKRGRNDTYTDKELKAILLKVKSTKFKGKVITANGLQTETGISRHTWTRRLGNIIKELNTAVKRNFELSPSDEVYFPNIYELFELYGDDKGKIISELLQYEQLFYDIYNEKEKYKEKYEKAIKQIQNIDSLEKDLKLQRERADYYRNLYQQILVSSHFPHLQSENGIKENLINFDKDKNHNINLSSLEQHFITTSQDTSENKELKAKENLSKLSKKFSNLIDND